MRHQETNQAVVRPNFFIVGAAKAGTTSLYQYLNQHPDVSMPTLKEPHYFGDQRPPGPVFSSERAYLDLFVNCRHGSAVGEASTAYLYSASAAQEIHKFNPTAKIIIVLRNPVDRAYSLYWHNVKAGVESLDFDAALAAEAQRIAAGDAFGFHYLSSGLYAKQVARYQDQFPDAQLKILLFEQLSQDPAAVAKALFEFLDVDAMVPVNVDAIFNRSGPPKHPWVSRVLSHNSGIKRRLLAMFPTELKNKWKQNIRDRNIGTTPSMNAQTRSRLQQLFRSDLEQLAKQIPQDLSAWLAVDS